MKAKYKVYLTDQVYAVATLDLSVPKDQEALAEALGIGKQERENLTGQKLQELLQLLGNSDET